MLPQKQSLFFFSILFICYLGCGGSWGYSIHVIFFFFSFFAGNEFAHQGAKKKHDLHYTLCDIGDTAYGVTLRFAFYSIPLERITERHGKIVISRQASTKKREAPTWSWSGSEQPGRMVFGLCKRAIGLDAMHSSPSHEEARRGKARRYASRRSCVV
ncbi:hypothetical protein V8C35DRAFT_36606 [Trichoderma chlorosporum]